MKLQGIFFPLLLIIMLVQSGCAHERDEDWYTRKRNEMVLKQLKARDITDDRVLEVMGKVPRHLFVPDKYRHSAYDDHPLPIGYDQTISQPYIVAYMTQALKLQGDERALEIGTGSGYQAAVLAELCAQVYSIEIVPQLAQSAAKRLKNLGYNNVRVKAGDGYKGWKEYAPYDVIIVTAAPPELPKPLVKQLKIGGRIVIPEGDYFQVLRLYTKTEKGLERENLLPVRFVPMIHGR